MNNPLDYGQQAGPSQFMPTEPQVIPQDSVFERNDAKTLYLLGYTAETAKKRQLSDLDYNYAAQGMSPDEIDAKHEQDRAYQAQMAQQQQAHNLAAKGLDMPKKDYQAMLEQELGNQPKRQVAGPPALNNVEAGLGILSAILDPHHAAQNTGAVLAGGVQARDRQQAQYDQQYQVDQSQHQERVALISKLYGIQQDQAESLVRQHEFDQRMKMETDALRQKGEDQKADHLDKAKQAYNTANSEGEKRVAFQDLNRQRLEAGLDPLPDDALNADLGRMRQQADQRAVDGWEKILERVVNSYGEVPESQRADLERLRSQIAKDNQVDPSRLRSVPTEKTLKSQLFDQRKAQFEQTFKFNKQKWQDTLADKLAQRDLEEKRIQETGRHNLTMEGIGQMNATTSRFNAVNKDVADGVDEALSGKNGKGGLKRDLAGVENALRFTTDKKKVDELTAKRNDIKGQIAYLESTKLPELPLWGMPGAGAMMPNPDYRQPKSSPMLPDQTIPLGPQTKKQKKNPVAPVIVKIPSGATLTRPDGSVVKG